MKIRKPIQIILNGLHFFILLLFSLHIFSQITISGQVVDEDGEAIEYVSVAVMNSSQGTITDSVGRFEIEIKSSKTKIDILLYRLLYRGERN